MELNSTFFSGVQAGPMDILEKSGVIATLGPENVCPHIEAALVRAREISGATAG